MLTIITLLILYLTIGYCINMAFSENNKINLFVLFLYPFILIVLSILLFIIISVDILEQIIQTHKEQDS